jgi:cytochrome c55X
LKNKLLQLAVLTVIVASKTSLAAMPSIERQKYLSELLKNDCGACHGLTLRGGIGSPLLPENLKGKSDEYLLKTILEGRPGTAMPPWHSFISKDETLWLIGKLRKQ